MQKYNLEWKNYLTYFDHIYQKLILLNHIFVKICDFGLGRHHHILIASSVCDLSGLSTTAHGASAFHYSCPSLRTFNPTICSFLILTQMMSFSGHFVSELFYLMTLGMYMYMYHLLAVVMIWVIYIWLCSSILMHWTILSACIVTLIATISESIDQPWQSFLASLLTNLFLCVQHEYYLKSVICSVILLIHCYICNCTSI